MLSKKRPELEPSAPGFAPEGERPRPAPAGLHRRIEKSVRYVVLQDRERRRFRETMAAGAAGMTAFATMAAVAFWNLSPLHRIAADSPGALGQLDRFSVFVANSWLVLAGLGACVLLATGALAVLLARMPGHLLARVHKHE